MFLKHVERARLPLIDRTHMANTHLFIDTNVFLKFYHFTSDDLGQLKSLIAYLKEGDLILHLPEQVLNELARNRENKLAEAATAFRKDSESFSGSIPRHMQDYPQAKEYTDATNAARKALNSMINQASEEAASNMLAADHLIKDLIKVAHVYQEDVEVFSRASVRSQKGNPPGKKGSMGDPYNWEYLLKHVPAGDLHIVSKDGDYISVLNSNMPLPFLQSEWSKEKTGSVYVYGTIKPFLGKYATKRQMDELDELVNNPVDIDEEIRLDDDDIALRDMAVDIIVQDKDEAIAMLVTSGSFATTHSAIERLEDLRAALNKDDAERLLTAAVDNNQISWIASDSDVYSFFKALLTDHPDLSEKLVAQAISLFGLAPTDEDAANE